MTDSDRWEEDQLWLKIRTIVRYAAWGWDERVAEDVKQQEMAENPEAGSRRDAELQDTTDLIDDLRDKVRKM